jgi:hypothetical protein
MQKLAKYATFYELYDLHWLFILRTVGCNEGFELDILNGSDVGDGCMLW